VLKRSYISDDEYVFLMSQHILISQVFDARGRGQSTFSDDAKRHGFLFGMANPCSKGGHRLFTRAGHCIQCDTSKIAFIRRHSGKGFVYIAATKKGRLFKVGSTTDISSRSHSLNIEGGYGGFDDWIIIAHAKVAEMGKVEFTIHSALNDLMIVLDYRKAGVNQTTRELLKGSLKRIWGAYKDAIEKAPLTDRWRHPGIQHFDF
jgi:hypothetical protein